jgi:transcriptional regulator with XRE-family HTH domain
VDKILSSEDVGFKLRMIRQKAELTQEQLAERIGVSTFQIRKYESGRDNINVEKLQQLAAVFSVPVQEFFTENSEVIPLQVSERVLLDSFRAIQDANVRESILQVVIHSAKVKE